METGTRLTLFCQRCLNSFEFEAAEPTPMGVLGRPGSSMPQLCPACDLSAKAAALSPEAFQPRLRGRIQASLYRGSPGRQG